MNFAAAEEIKKEMKKGKLRRGAQNSSSSSHSSIQVNLYFK